MILSLFIAYALKTLSVKRKQYKLKKTVKEDGAIKADT